MNRTLVRRRLALVMLAMVSGAACVSASQNVRPTVLARGELRVAAAMGTSFNLGSRFIDAEPSLALSDPSYSAGNAALSVHYGMLDDLDVGLRVRPVARGGKLELAYQLLRQEHHGVGLLIGLGVDGVHQPRRRLDCDDAGCFSREYWGVAGDLPVVVSRKFASHGTVFAGLRYQHLWMEGDQRYRSTTDAFAPLVLRKAFNQPIGGWVAGLSMGTQRVTFMPACYGAVLEDAGRIEHAIFCDAEVAVIF